MIRLRRRPWYRKKQQVPDVDGDVEEVYGGSSVLVGTTSTYLCIMCGWDKYSIHICCIDGGVDLSNGWPVEREECIRKEKKKAFHLLLIKVDARRAVLNHPMHS
jgi:hypothetical protein